MPRLSPAWLLFRTAVVTGSLLDAYSRALSELEESAFQRAIVQRLLVALNNFQTVPSNPQGDGGLDGHSDKRTRAYCCYGLKYSSAKTDKQRTRQLVTKFSSDLQRLYEVEPKGKGFQHKDNEALLRIFGALPHVNERICQVTLIANWFDSHEPLGSIIQNGLKYGKASLCRWIKPDADVVLKGPREFADQFGADQSTMLWLKHQELWDHLDVEGPKTELPDGPTFDSKMAAAEGLRPDLREEVRELAELLKADWQRSIALERQLSDRLPHLGTALERGRRRLKVSVLTQTPSDPWETIRRSQEIAESVFSDDFLAVYGQGLVRDMASGEIARLLGTCHINWKPRAPNDK